MRVTLIAGLPGSGKTTLAWKLAAETPGCVVLDDPETLEALADIDSAPAAVITHPAFCGERARANAEQAVLARRPDAVLRWIFFENDQVACRANVSHRRDGRRVDGFISLLSRDYKVPEAADVRPVPVAGGPDAWHQPQSGP